MLATGSRGHIQEREFEQICDQYKIKQKIDRIICDNAANMKKAFTTCFPSSAEADEDEDDCLDVAELWNAEHFYEVLKRKLGRSEPI